jgi:hypothetical protein
VSTPKIERPTVDIAKTVGSLEVDSLALVLVLVSLEATSTVHWFKKTKAIPKGLWSIFLSHSCRDLRHY